MGKKPILDCYIRVSSTSQKEDGNSLVVQEHLGKKVSENLGMEFRLRNEGAKSSIGYREVLEELKDDISQGKVRNIWAQDRSRMFRDYVDGGLFRRNYLEKYKVALYEGELPSKVGYDNFQDSVVYDIITRLQQYDNELRTDKFQRGKRYKLKNESAEKPVYLGGTPLFGYTNKDKLWTIDRPTARWVKWIFNSYEKGMSVKKIKDYLDNEGVPSARTKNGLWNATTLQKMLRNKSYTGLHTVNIYKKISREEYLEGVVRNPPTFVKIGNIYKQIVSTYTYKVPKIIQNGQFNRVQKIMDKNHKNHSNNKRHFSLLEDILVCECGSHIGSHEKNTTSSLGYKVNTRKYYCVSKNNDWRDGKGRNCKNRMSLQMDATNEYILKRVKEVVAQSDILKSKFKSQILDEVFDKRKNLKEHEKKLERKLERLQKDMENTENHIVKNEVDANLGKRDKGLAAKVIQKYEEHLKSAKEVYTQTEKEIDDLGREQKWVKWVERYGDKLELDTSSETLQRDFLMGVLDKVVVRSEFGYGRDKSKKVQRGHSLDFHYQLKIVDDGFAWTDKSTSPWNSITVDGTKIDRQPMVRLVASRKKKVEKTDGLMG